MSTEAWAEQVITKAAGDAAFKKALLNDPKAAIKQATGHELSADVDLEVVEKPDGTVELIMSDTDELTDDDLNQVAGGFGGNPRRRNRDDD